MWIKLAGSTVAIYVASSIVSRVAFAHGGASLEHSPLPWSFPEAFFGFAVYAGATLLGFLLGRMVYEADGSLMPVQNVSDAINRSKLFRVISSRSKEGGNVA